MLYYSAQTYRTYFKLLKIFLLSSFFWCCSYFKLLEALHLYRKRLLWGSMRKMAGLVLFLSFFFSSSLARKLGSDGNKSDLERLKHTSFAVNIIFIDTAPSDPSMR